MRDDRIDEGVGRVPFLGNVHDDNTFVNVHLACRQADSGRGVHGLEQIVDQLPDRIVHRGHRLGPGAQPRIGITEYGQLGHGLALIGTRRGRA